MTSEQRQTSPLMVKDIPVRTDVSRPLSPSSQSALLVGTDVSRPLFRKPPEQWVFRIATFGIILVLLSGCVTLLWQMQQGSFASHALPAMPADVSVVGPPSLSAATVNAIFAGFGSPMAGTGATVETLSRQYNIDDAFALGVWWTETNDGMAGVGSADRNPGSVRGSPGYPSAWDGYTIYPSYTAAISDWFNILNGRYIRSGLTTVFSIARPYVGTSSYPLWAGKVIALIYRYRGIAPPPPPPATSTPTPKPTPKPVPTLSPALVVQQHRLATLVPREADFAYIRARQGLDTEINQPAPAQITPPVVPVTPAYAPALPTGLLYLIMGLGLLAALLIALYARTIGRSTSVTVVPTTGALETVPQTLAIFSPLESQAALALAAIAPSATAWDALQPVHVGSFAISYTRNTDELKPSLSDMASVSQPAHGWEPATSGFQLPFPDTTSQIAHGGQFSPQPSRPSYLPSRPRQTGAVPHRTLFLPSQPDQRVPVAAGSTGERSERPAGLLTRYKSNL